MTLIVWVCAAPCFAFESRPDSSGAMRENRPFAVGVLQRCPKAIPVARTSTMRVLKRLPQAALWRSLRPVGLLFVAVTIESHPFFKERGETIQLRTLVMLHGKHQLLWSISLKRRGL